MGIYVDNQLKYVVDGAKMNTSLTLPSGKQNTVVEEWDYCGGATTTPIALNVTSGTQSAVYVTTPTNDASVGTSVGFEASATSSCSGGVTAMGVYVNNQLAAVGSGSSFNQQVTMSPGTQNVVVQSWDACGNSAKQPMTLSVQGSSTSTSSSSTSTTAPSSNVKTLSNIQAVGNWDQWGELAPVYAICSPCSGVTWGMTQHESSVSLSGNGTRFDIGGTTPYSDVLWSNKLIGQGTTENMPDTSETILPNIHNMQYDAYVYVTNAAVTQDLEFDVNIYMKGVGMEWGTQCNHLADGDWDVWDNVNAHWDSTGVPCKLVNNAWNHVTFTVERLSNNDLVYQNITLNGVTSVINKTYPPFAVSSGWYGLTVNYQMDGNYKMAANTTYLDNFSLEYW
jgi:hypothetical protein